MEKFRLILAFVIFIVGLVWSIEDFISYSGILASLATLFGSLALALSIYPGRNAINPVIEIIVTITAALGIFAFFLHTPALDFERTDADIDFLFSAINKLPINSIPSEKFTQLIKDCALQSNKDIIASTIQAENLKDSDAVSFSKRATGSNFQPDPDQCVNDVTSINKEYPDFFAGKKEEIEKLTRKKYMLSW